jgi:hypothetical protein
MNTEKLVLFIDDETKRLLEVMLKKMDQKEWYLDDSLIQDRADLGDAFASLYRSSLKIQNERGDTHGA